MNDSFALTGVVFRMSCGYIFTAFCVYSSRPIAVSINEHRALYWLRFIANFSSCTNTEVSKLLTSCLTAIKII